MPFHEAKLDQRIVANLLVAILALVVMETAYLSACVAQPLAKLTHIVDDHSQKIDSISKMLSVQFQPEAAKQIEKLYRERLDEISTR